MSDTPTASTTRRAPSLPGLTTRADDEHLDKPTLRAHPAERQPARTWPARQGRLVELTGKVEEIDLNEEIQKSYLDYAMSVIVGRALPDVRDGLKPVHRRVLYTMYDGGYRPDRGWNKCSRVVGDVMGKYHPHGDSAIYDTLVRLAQPWVMRHKLVDGQGNFGSPGNDGAAAMRYTECKMNAAGHGDGPRHRPEHRRLPAELRQQGHRAGRAAGAVPEPAGQRLDRHRGRHGDEHPAAQPARGQRRRAVDAGAPRGVQGGEPRGLHGAHQGAGLPQRRAHRRPQGHRGRLPHRPRAGHHARGHRHRGGQQGAHLARRHRAAAHVQPRQPGAEDRRAGELGAPDRHRRHPRRLVGAHRPAPGDRAQARRPAARGDEQPVQAHAAAGHVRLQHAGDRRRRAAHAAPRPVHGLLDPPPGAGHPAPDAVPPREARAGRPPAPRPGQGPQHARRGHRADPRGRRPSTPRAPA